MTTSPLPECGFRIEPFLGPEEIAALTELHNQINTNRTAEHQNTIVGASSDKKRKIFEGIRDIVEPQLKSLAPGHRLFSAFFITKKAESSPKGRLGIHPDPTTVNLAEAVGVNLWVPLCDVDQNNGCMKVVEYSPRIGHIRALPPFNPSPYDSIQHEIESSFMTPIPQEAGSACLFDTRLLHATEANRSSRDRIAVLMSLIPDGKAPCIYFWNPEDPRHLELYEIDQEFLFDLNPIQYPGEEVRARARFIANVAYAPQQMSLAEFEKVVPRPAKSQPDPGTPEPISAPAPARHPSVWTRLKYLFASQPR